MKNSRGSFRAVVNTSFILNWENRRRTRGNRTCILNAVIINYVNSCVCLNLAKVTQKLASAAEEYKMVPHI